MFRRRGRFVWVLAGLLVLGGCTPAEGEDPPSATPSETVSESSEPTTDDPTDGGSEEPTHEVPEPPEVEAPARPAEMDEETVAGAIAAAKYFVELMPYVNGTGDTSEWEAMSDEGCGFCGSVSSAALELHDSGGFATGGDVEIYDEDGGGPYEQGAYIVNLGLTMEAMEFHRKDGTVDSFQAEDRPEFMLSMIWRDAGWRVTGVDQGSAT